MRLPVPFSFGVRVRLLAALGAALGFLTWSVPAIADDPFDMEPSSWVSFDRYKEKPANWIPPEVRAQAALEPVVASPPTLPADMPTVIEPSRPIETPVLPGVNKDFGMNVSSTADDNRLPAIFDDKGLDPGVPQNSWKDAVQFARARKVAHTDDGNGDSGPLDVRFTYLPGMMSPVPKPQKPVFESVVKKIEVAVVKSPLPVTVAPPPLDPAACAAIDAYKKRQLAAIESDRQTLTALQTAIAQLGLQKKLDFMIGASGNLKLQEAGSATMDMPAAKN